MTVPKRKSIHECGYGHGDMAGRSRISICKPGMASDEHGVPRDDPIVVSDLD